MEKLGPYELNQIYTGDARELAEGIPDDSIDLILCDPVYWEVEHYLWLGKVGERILKSGCSLIAQAGSEYRYDAETQLRKYLMPMPLISEMYPFSRQQMYKYRVITRWKPHLWFSKGDRLGNWCFDGTYYTGIDKNFHLWGDNGRLFSEYILRLTQPDAIVFDPFTGGGTVPAVCKMLGRNYLAFEIDPTTAKKARERVLMTQPPLLLPEPIQLELG